MVSRAGVGGSILDVGAVEGQGRAMSERWSQQELANRAEQLRSLALDAAADNFAELQQVKAEVAWHKRAVDVALALKAEAEAEAATLTAELAAAQATLARVREWASLGRLSYLDRQELDAILNPPATEPTPRSGNPLQHELLDLITLMPDSQTQEIIDYIMQLRAARTDHTFVDKDGDYINLHTYKVKDTP